MKTLPCLSAFEVTEKSWIGRFPTQNSKDPSPRQLQTLKNRIDKIYRLKIKTKKIEEETAAWIDKQGLS